MRIDEATPDEIRAVAMDMRGSDYDEFSALSFAADRPALAAELVGRFTGRKDILVGALDEPICIGGVIETRPNVITLLFYATDRFPEIGVPMTRFIKQRLFSRLKEAGVHRIEAVSIVGHEDAHRWLEAIGLSEETNELAGYGKNGEAFKIYSWVKPCS